jgi:protein-S-isoprenylcysteine O-methyltransferase Ste14
MNSSRRWPWIAPILLYAASALEMIIMVTPFAAYFYSVYTPLFDGLEQSAATAWLPQFFLPHLAYTKISLFRGFNWLGAILSLIGIVGFFACAIQLYYGKFIKKQLVSGGLYGRVRHPQYLLLMIGGAGFLLLWPRFFILTTYLMMLGLYYILARHEEETIRERYGSASDDYLARVPMFNPFRAPGQVGEPVARSRAITIWLTVVAASMVVAFGLRAVAVSQLYAVQTSLPGQSQNVTALSFRAMNDGAIRLTMASVLETQSLQTLLEQDPDMALFMQINNGRSQLTHLLIDLGMTPEARGALGGPKDGYYIVVSQVVARDPDVQKPPGVFSLGARIEPLFLVGPGDQAGDQAGDLTVSELTTDQFYQGFARILF